MWVDSVFVPFFGVCLVVRYERETKKSTKEEEKNPKGNVNERDEKK